MLLMKIRPFLIFVTVGQDALAARQLSFEVKVNYLANLEQLNLPDSSCQKLLAMIVLLHVLDCDLLLSLKYNLMT